MKKFLAMTGFVALLVNSDPALALMGAFSTEELIRESDTVVEGNVGQVDSYWSADGKRILSSATISVVETVRGGQERGTVIVEYEGGEIGEIGMRVSDMEPFNRGDRVLLFLKSHKSSDGGEIHRLVGLSQGKYTIGADGIARKSGFSLPAGKAAVDNIIDTHVLKDRIKRFK